MPADELVDRGALVVAIDGPSGAGKSTVARAVAAALALRYLDTGATYRAVTWWTLRESLDLADAAALEQAARAVVADLEIATDPADALVRVGAHDVTAAIRSPEVTAAVSAVSAEPRVREALVAFQRSVIGSGRIVVEGRDIGTVVVPTAPVKIYLTAAADTRAVRRSRDLIRAGSSGEPVVAGGTDIDAVRQDLARRDLHDSGRSLSPLAQAADAVVLDSTGVALPEVVAAVLAVVLERTGVKPVSAEPNRE